MTTATTVAQMLIRITGLILIVLGLLFWTNNALNLVPVHIGIGFVLVLALWAMAIVAALAGVGLGPAILAVVWGFLVVALGLSQTGLLVGGLQWVVEVLHLLVGLAAIAQGEWLAARIKQARPQEM